MNISFELYKVFYYVAQQKNITKAAQYLNVSQPAVTKQIKNLENLLGFSLITKVSKGIILTEYGEKLYNSIKEPIENLLNIEKNVKFKEVNKEYTIKLIASTSVMKIFLNKKLIEFSKKYPNVKFRITADRHPEAIQKLRNGEVDLILLNRKRYTQQYPELIVQECFTTNDIFVVNSEISDQYPKQIKIKDINKYPILCIDVETAAKESISEELMKYNEVFTPKYELTQENITIAFVKDKLGIGLVTKECVETELNNNELTEIEHDIVFPKREICYAIRKNSVGYKFLQEFIKELKS